MPKYAFRGILTAFMKAIHIKLPNERIDLGMSEMVGKDKILKFVDVLDNKFLARR